MVHNKIMKETTVIHRENECEWRFVGIWADMLDKSILDFDEENKKDYSYCLRNMIVLYRYYRKIFVCEICTTSIYKIIQ